MTSTQWTAAPAGFLGLGGFDVRVCGAPARGDVFAMVGTAGADVRLRPASVQMVPAEKQPRIAPTYIALNDGTALYDGTTLGIPSSRRPQS